MNNLLFNQESAMLSAVETLEQAEREEAKLDLLKAARKLCKPDYERYKANRKRANEKYQMSLDDNVFCIACIDYPNCPPCCFQSRDDECSCEGRVTQEGQCSHKIILRGGFCKADFERRHMRRSKVTGSLIGW